MAAQAGLSVPWSETPNRFSRDEAQFNYDDHDDDDGEGHDDGDHLCAYTRAPARESDVICDR